MRILLISLILTSCTVTWLPSYDAVISQDVLNAKQQTDELYLKMQNSTDKSFSIYAIDYANLEAAINAILVKQSLRPQGTSFVSLIENVQKLYVKYQAEHKEKGVVNNTELSLYNQYMQAAWQAVANSENSLKK